MTTLQTARKYEEMLASDVEAAPYDYAMLFKAQGFWARRRAQKRFKLLQSVDPKLRRILLPGEKVYFITTGTTVSLGERFFVGWLAFYLNMRVLVFTSTRVLLMQINSRKRVRELVSQMTYATIASIRSTWNGLCRVKMIDRTTYNFQNVPRADRKLLSKFLLGIVQGTNAPFQRDRGIEHLCPHCFALVPGYPLACPACHGGFKSARKAGLRSLLFPGLGDWYLGHRVFAVLEMLGASFFWLVLIFLPLLVPPDPKVGPPDKGYWITVGLILLATHFISGMMAHHFARKGHHPEGVPPDLSGEPQLQAAQSMPKPDRSASKKLSLNRPPSG
jgi:hypothetical protein